MKTLYKLLFLVLPYAAFGQLTPSDSVWFSGRIYDATSIEPLHSAVVLFQGRTLGSDNSGRFSLKLSTKDTLIFSHIGYKPVIYIPKDSLKSTNNLVAVFMHPTDILLSEILVLPRYPNTSVIVTTDAATVQKYNNSAAHNFEMGKQQARRPPAKMDAEMNKKMVIGTKAQEVSYRGMINPGEMIGVNVMTAVPEAIKEIKGKNDKDITIRLGQTITDEENEYLINIYKATKYEQLKHPLLDSILHKN